MNFTQWMVAVLAALLVSQASADLISELQPNPPGGDPATQQVELTGTPLAAFDLWLVTIESDPGGTQGVVDRAASVTGTYDASGIAVVEIPDLENPSFALVLSSTFTGVAGTGGTDVDTDNDGIVDDLSAFGGIMDAIGILEDVGDPAYGIGFSGLDFTPTGNSTDPLGVFRDGATGNWFNVEPSGDVYDLAGVLVAGSFTSDPATPTFGSANPSLIPEPTTLVLLGMGGLVVFFRRRS